MSHAQAHSHAGESHGSVRSYAIGFILSVILTVIPFAMVMSGDFSRSVALTSMVVLGVVQVLVHLVCFLHMNTSSEGRWNLLAFLFTVLIIVMLVGLAIWIMVNADQLMMPWM
ncbi:MULTISPECIES: cytochrome o ubiquinol oxidase subunit IV [Pseudomonas]|jgi:cytochrome o ubiquinol oxidase operon protein cyoD|uniref:cytochrome o ubiquinol oxidase subunit IV n=1 Tax=Pseudomonas TaxID=286 RepID=UPI000854AC28|nr:MULTISPECIES: cytochrome o ubiquinol oxidase subunit IV [Pseudomonas]MAB97320.1 cytochrome o ubiquinol oxidase subunit IV [Pseudomonadaceae bacterium]MBQ53694.1 cytochrome o ubiquinol oxidase subunit IV [Pseudomonadaceae bacterium]NRH28628.1 cytochrome o ubiquinol oxidase subunit IV [Pseudomonas sp. MS19]OEO24967.1 cytochrome o ubiquinol oxidase subunit IV [Pseudomonas sp. J237]SFU12336.1 cytochrome o ubiquinol oxidase operon protein cyoD [Pseudomonas marincola]|tara:strand:+ start:108 stop:446 length:339 start_codon:yes stop_codon:yes gene_type:complete